MKRNANHAFQAIIFTSAALLAAPAFAYDAPIPVAKVSAVEGSYLPGAVAFQIDQTVANCPGGEWIHWDGGAAYPPNASVDADRKANVKAVHNTLMATMLANGRV